VRVCGIITRHGRPTREWRGRYTKSTNDLNRSKYLFHKKWRSYKWTARHWKNLHSVEIVTALECNCWHGSEVRKQQTSSKNVVKQWSQNLLNGTGAHKNLKPFPTCVVSTYVICVSDCTRKWFPLSSRSVECTFE